jgi:hypothetical protein
LANRVAFGLNDRPLFVSSVDTKVDRSFRATFDYGRAFSGPKHVDIVSADGKIATAVVDGRPTLPFLVDKSGAEPLVRFENGKTIPGNEIVDPELAKESGKLIEDVARDSEACLKGKVAAAAAGTPIRAVTANVRAAAAVSLTQDPVGTFSGISGTQCALAQLGVGVAYRGCLGGGAAASAGCGPLAWGCVIAVVVGCTAGAIGASAAVANNAVCCPSDCNKGDFSPNCCDDRGECMNNGTQCCENGSACGAECCAPNIKCVGGATCCKPGAECGSACCDDGKGLGGVCVNAATSTCCLAPNTPCSVSACCAPGEICSPGPDLRGLCTPGPACLSGVVACPDGSVTNCPVDLHEGSSTCVDGCCSFNGR